MTTIHLKQNREGPSRTHHPWIYSGAIARVEGPAEPGAVVTVIDAAGSFVAYGQLSPESQIRVRLLEWREEVRVDEGWWRKSIETALSMRLGRRTAIDASAYRLIHAEADLLPGLIVDLYGGYVVLQALTAGAEREKTAIAAILEELLRPEGIFERSDAEVRLREGLQPERGVLRGEEPPPLVEISEGPARFLVDIASGQKTGFYLDQRENRRVTAGYATGRSVLDCFAYTGAFAVHALLAGAERVTLVDSSNAALELAKRNMALNGFGDGPVEYLEGNGAAVLRSFRDSRRSFDLIILDPPKFARTRSQVDKAVRAYKDVNLLAMKLLNPGGVLATFSCSAGVGLELFSEIIRWAALDADRRVQIIERLGQPLDHPVLASFPASEYLTGCLCRVI